ncbi:MAG TPA: hypothetical protein PK880_06980 [Candidatus Competibacter sp.]|nr:hypothetical protein [Candidatus Competibacteraceae bacterium]HRC72263.1 hypothetical protein [Candidatus Competibacter sp.]
MRRYCIISFLCLSLLSSVALAGVTQNDAALILDTLLDLENPAHRSTNEQGKPVYDALRAYQDWAALYQKYAQRDRDSAQFSQDSLRVYLLLGWIAQAKLDAATMEAFAGDLVPLYERNEESVLGVLKDLPFLISSTCRYLDRHFGFEDKNRDKKPVFLAAHADRIKQVLTPKDAESCIRYFED